ncbi:MAG TPA: carbohydrate ABC transporter permease [Natronosporangium sp.]
MTTVTAPIDERDRTRDPRRPRWMEEPSPLAKFGKAVLLTGICLLVLIPMYVIVLTSLSSTETVNEAGGMVLVPGELTLDAYVRIFSGGVVTRAVAVSTGVTIVGTALSLAVTILAAYGLSRPGSLFHRPLLVFVLITFVIGPGIIPTYLVVSQLGLIDSYWSLILPSAVNAFNLVVMRAFFMNIPSEVIDSARIDGANDFKILWRIVMPLSKAVIAVVGLFYAVGYWNAFFNALLYIKDSDKWPVQLVLRQYVVQGSPLPTGAGGLPPSSEVLGNMASASPLSIKMAIVVITLLPVVIMYPFVQRHFTKGVILGAIKG